MHLLAVFIFAIGSVVCHQRPDRSFFWEGHQLPVCARCTGLYAGAVVGLLVWFGVKLARRRRPIAIRPDVALRVLALAALPTALSWLSGALGLWDGTNVTRAMLSIPLGVSAGAIVAAVAAKDLR
jgi:uncharacterized membrane protein